MALIKHLLISLCYDQLFIWMEFQKHTNTKNKNETKQNKTKTITNIKLIIKSIEREKVRFRIHHAREKRQFSQQCNRSRRRATETKRPIKTSSKQGMKGTGGGGGGGGWVGDLDAPLLSLMGVSPPDTVKKQSSANLWYIFTI